MRVQFLSLLFLGIPSRVLAFTLPASRAVNHSVFTRYSLAQVIRHVASGSNQDELRLPTVEQASSDPFMEQISHASKIVSMMHDKEMCDEKALDSLLKAQLSHSDGIRGFFATYLTSDDENAAADEEVVPKSLVEAVEAADASVIMPLAFMNVIMPTAMSTLHKDPKLQSSAALTAKRGGRILSILSECQNMLFETNRQAIIKATSVTISNDVDISDEKVQYWGNFFKNYKYGDQQKQDIAEIMETFSP